MDWKAYEAEMAKKGTKKRPKLTEEERTKIFENLVAIAIRRYKATLLRMER